MRNEKWISWLGFVFICLVSTACQSIDNFTLATLEPIIAVEQPMATDFLITPSLIAHPSLTYTLTPSGTRATTGLTITTTPTPLSFPTSTPVGLPRGIGFSHLGYPLEAYTFGQGNTHLLFVGGMHGGYEWNTILLAYEAIDYFRMHPSAIPPNLTMIIIPSANPDGQYLVTGRVGRFTLGDVIMDTEPGRFNGANVDLNRNWDCEWSSTSTWRDQPVSGGTGPFSEPENRAIRDYILEIQPEMVLFWHSAANGVFAAGCPETHEPSYALALVYGQASGYPVYERFAFYPITGDASDWLSTVGISSISVELITHEELDWSQNLAGMLALLDHYRVVP